MLSERIRKFREAKGLSRRELATSMGVTTTAVYLWEMGSRTPPIARLAELARVLDVAQADFFTIEVQGG